MRIGVIGTDSSHAVAFGERLLAKGHTLTAYKGGSTAAISVERIERFSEQLLALHVPFVASLDELVLCSDALLLTSVDAAQHVEQLSEVVAARKPIFIDKPLAPTVEEVDMILALAAKYDTPIFSSSALRYAREVVAAKAPQAVDIIAPLPMLQPYDYFYYGIHAVELLDALVPLNIASVHVEVSEHMHTIVLTAKDRTVSTIRGMLSGDMFQFVTHEATQCTMHTIAAGDLSFYDALVTQIEQFFMTAKSPVPLARTRQIIALLQLIEQSARTGETLAHQVF